jgi:iron complex outermembrane recepter protein
MPEMTPSIDFADLRRRRTAVAVATGAAAVLMGPFEAHAQSGTPATLPPVEIVRGAPAPLERVNEAGSRLGLSAREIPASMDSVNQAELQERGNATLAESTRGLVGIHSALRAGAPGVFSSRGYTENGLAILFDGIRVGGATLTMRNADSFNYERIEVLRGPASVLHGEGAGAGAINFVRRSPQGGPLRADTLLQIGSDRQLRVGATIAGDLGGAQALVSLSHHRFDGPAQAQSSRFNHLVAGVRRPISAEWSVFAEADVLDQSVDNAYWGTPLIRGALAPELARRNYNQAPDNRHDDRVTWLRAGVEGSIHVGGHPLGYKGQVFRYEAERDWKNFYAFSSTTVAGRIQPRAVENLAYDHVMTGTRHEARFGPAAVRSVVGSELQVTDFSSPRSTSTSRPDFDPLDPRPVSFDALALPRADARRAEVRQIAVFAENRWAVTPTLSLVSGLRHNRLDASIRRPNANIAFDADFAYTDARVGASWRIAQPATLYASVATGREPVESLFIYDPTQAGFDLTRFEALEAGVKVELPGQLGEFTTAAYQIERQDLPAADPNVAGAFAQVGRQRSRGVEWTLRLRPAATVTVDANAALVSARFVTPVNFVGGVGSVAAGATPPNVPDVMLHLAPTWRVGERLTLGAIAQHVGVRQANIANTLALPAYTTIDAWMRWTLGTASDLTLRVRNLGDETPVVWASSGFGQVNAVYGDPRRVELTWRGRF